jgi:DNA-binding NtrC family response regulator
MQETISLVILDLTMPAMGGQEALQHIRAIRADVPVVLSSGYREADAMSKFANDSLAGFVQKPYTSTDLYEKVDAALAAGSTRNTNSFTPQS